MMDREANDPTERVEWDEEVTSLGRRTRSDGAVRWIVQMRVDGRMRKRVIGDGDRLTAEDARRAAIVAMERMRIGAPVSCIERIWTGDVCVRRTWGGRLSPSSRCM